MAALVIGLAFTVSVCSLSKPTTSSTPTATSAPPTATSTPGRIVEFTVLPAGAVWVTYSSKDDIQTGGIARVTPAGAVSRFALPSSSGHPAGTLSIVAGPDGTLWFTEPYAGKIGRITTGGVVTEFPLPLANSRPWAITAGSDGTAKSAESV